MPGGPTPFWVSTYTSYLLYKVQDPFSACRESITRNVLSFSLVLRGDQSLLHRPRKSGRECAWWTNFLLGQYLHLLSLVQSSRSIQHIQKNKTFQNILSVSSILREDQSPFHTPRKSGRECAWWTSSLVGQYLHQLSLSQSSRSFQHMYTQSQQNHFFFLFTFMGGPIFVSNINKLRKKLFFLQLSEPVKSCKEKENYF